MDCQFTKTYQNKNNSFSLQIQTSFQHNAINVIFGPSGSGKTSLLRLISGLDTIDEGSIRVGKTYWTNTIKKINIPLKQRKIAYVFQENSLFPNMTVLKNLLFAQTQKNTDLLDELIATLEIKQILNSKPSQLSGGQKQRIALARAILQQPDYLLLDEPLTALDEPLRKKLQSYLVLLQKKHQFTVIMVSHNIHEVIKIADHVCLVNYGEVIEQGAPELLIAKNPNNTLTGTVLNIQDSLVSVLVGVQKIQLKTSQITTPNYSVGDEIVFKIS